jgi:hypothetical protein
MAATAGHDGSHKGTRQRDKAGHTLGVCPACPALLRDKAGQCPAMSRMSRWGSGEAEPACAALGCLTGVSGLGRRPVRRIGRPAIQPTTARPGASLALLIGLRRSARGLQS